MSVAEPIKQDAKKASKEPPKPLEERSVIYVPLGSKEKVELKFDYVRKFLCTPTKAGIYPSDADVIKFMKLCERQALDPWVGDAYLTGYDTFDQASGKTVATFSLITAIQALLKRAEICPGFDGIESGVLIMKGEEIVERKGTIVIAGENLVGGWGKVYRTDRKIPFYQTVQIQTYDTGRSRWKKDRSGMITKCGKAAALREAFPTHLAGMYTEEEMGRVVEGEVARIAQDTSFTQAAITSKVQTSSDLAEIIRARNEAAAEGETVVREGRKANRDRKPAREVEHEPENEPEEETSEFKSLVVEMAECREPDTLDMIAADIKNFDFTDGQRSLLLGHLDRAKSRLGC